MQVPHGPYLRPWPVSDLRLCVGPGWGDIVEALVADLFAAGWDGSVHQVKEKFGGLRFYIGYGNDEMYNLIDAAERQSFKTCEHCGTTDNVEVKADHGWIQTLCTACRQGA